MVLKNERLATILIKMVRGFFFDLTKRQISADYFIEIHKVGASLEDVPASIVPVLQANERQILALPEKVVGDRAFSCRYMLSPEDANLSVWRFEFYGVIAYMGYTIKKDETGNSIISIEDEPDEDQ